MICFITRLTRWVDRLKLSVKYIIVVSIRFIGSTVNVSGSVLGALSFFCFNWRHLILWSRGLLASHIICLGLWATALAVCGFSMFFCCPSDASDSISSNSVPNCVTISSYVPLSKLASSIDFSKCGGNSAYMVGSKAASAQIPIAFFASSWNSSLGTANF